VRNSMSAKRIVIADDEPVTRMSIASMLKAIGFEVVGQASDGFDAVELCKAYHPDLALLDIKMPILDGLSAAQMIHSQQLADCLVLLTAYSDGEMIEGAKKAGVSGYLVKPVNERLLLPTLEVAMEQSRLLRESQKETELARQKLQEQQVIRRAQKLLAERLSITEAEAYSRLRTDAMKKRVSIASLAQLVVDSAGRDDSLSRAKKLLMTKKGMSEASAYKAICALAAAKDLTPEKAAAFLLKEGGCS